MKPKSFAGMRCSIAGALEVVGDRWTLLLIRDLSLGFRRYDDLRTNTGIPPATLSSRLKHLVEQGITDFSIDINGANLEYATPAYRATIQGEMDRLSALGSVGVRQRGSYDHSQLPMLMSRVDWVVVQIGRAHV